MDLHEFFDQHQQFLVGEWLQADDGREHVLKVLACKAALSESTSQGLVGEHATAAVFDGGCVPPMIMPRYCALPWSVSLYMVRIFS